VKSRSRAELFVAENFMTVQEVWIRGIF